MTKSVTERAISTAEEMAEREPTGGPKTQYPSGIEAALINYVDRMRREGPVEDEPQRIAITSTWASVLPLRLSKARRTDRHDDVAPWSSRRSTGSLQGAGTLGNIFGDPCCDSGEDGARQAVLTCALTRRPMWYET